MKKYGYLISIVGSVILLDQITKFQISSRMDLYETVVLIPGFLNFTYIHNNGAAFGILSGTDSPWVPYFFMAVTFIAIGVLGVLYRSTQPYQFWYRTAYALILGGAIGNLIDRIRFDSVVDFVDCYVDTYHWPAFNVADSCISIGVIILGIVLLFEKEREEKDHPVQSTVSG